MPNIRATFEYDARQALQTLLERIAARDAALAERIQRSIDMGREVLDRSGESNGKRRKRPREYRKTVAFTHEEALQIALEILGAYFVEQPQFALSMHDSFRAAELGMGESRARTLQGTHEGSGMAKDLKIELRPPTSLEGGASDDMQTLPTPTAAEIEVQQRNLDKLRSLVTFGGRDADASRS